MTPGACSRQHRRAHVRAAQLRRNAEPLQQGGDLHDPWEGLFITTKKGRIGSCSANASSAGPSQEPSTSTDARGQGWPQAIAKRRGASLTPGTGVGPLRREGKADRVVARAFRCPQDCRRPRSSSRSEDGMPWCGPPRRPMPAGGRQQAGRERARSRRVSGALIHRKTKSAVTLACCGLLDQRSRCATTGAT